MCIAILSTAHPKYRLILIDNRDEFVNRPTAKAHWWKSRQTDSALAESSQNPKASPRRIFGGRDLLRPVNGTWLAVTTTGRIAVLTNFKEDTPPPPGATSRGEIIVNFLEANEELSTEAWIGKIVQHRVARDAGGFSLVCGRVAEGERLAVVSNRTKMSQSSTSEANGDQTHARANVPWICGDVSQTIALSNAAFESEGGDRWLKIREGEELMLQTLRENIRDEGSEEDLIKALLSILGDDTLKRLGCATENGLNACISELRNTIFVPPLGRKDVTGKSPSEIAAAKKDEVAEVLNSKEKLQDTKGELGMSGIYATQKQSVVLVDHQNRVRFFERTLWDEDSNPVPAGASDIDEQFQIG